MPIKRVTLSLPDDLAKDLTYIHRRIGISKSALVASLLSDAVPDLRALLEQLPPEPDDKDLLRLRGASIDLITQRMNSVLHEVGGTDNAL